MVLPISFTMVSIYLGLGLCALTDLLGSTYGMGFGFGSGAWGAETVGVALLWPTLGFGASLFPITSSLSLFFSSFHSTFGTNLGILPSISSLSFILSF